MCNVYCSRLRYRPKNWCFFFFFSSSLVGVSAKYTKKFYFTHDRKSPKNFHFSRYKIACNCRIKKNISFHFIFFLFVSLFHICFVLCFFCLICLFVCLPFIFIFGRFGFFFLLNYLHFISQCEQYFHRWTFHFDGKCEQTE